VKVTPRIREHQHTPFRLLDRHAPPRFEQQRTDVAVTPKMGLRARRGPAHRNGRSQELPQRRKRLQTKRLPERVVNHALASISIDAIVKDEVT
jgi:hypothetical protein